MALVTTPAVVLRTYPYSETSKIVRLATRDLGVQSAIAKGVLRPKSRFAAAPGLPSEGVAQRYHPEPRGVPTLAAFDLVVPRREPAPEVRRFAAATARAAPRGHPPAPNAPRAPLRPRAPAPAAAPRRAAARFVRRPFGEPSSPPALAFWGRHAWSPPLPSAISAWAPPPAPAPAPAPSA